MPLRLNVLNKICIGPARSPFSKTLRHFFPAVLSVFVKLQCFLGNEVFGDSLKTELHTLAYISQSSISRRDMLWEETLLGQKEE